MIRVPWMPKDLSDLAAIDPSDVGAVSKFAVRHGRSAMSVSSKLALLRARSAAPERAFPLDHNEPAPSDQAAEDRAFQRAMKIAIERGLERLPS
jgi:hypothetical protein